MDDSERQAFEKVIEMGRGRGLKRNARRPLWNADEAGRKRKQTRARKAKWTVPFFFFLSGDNGHDAMYCDGHWEQHGITRGANPACDVPPRETTAVACCGRTKGSRSSGLQACVVYVHKYAGAVVCTFAVRSAELTVTVWIPPRVPVLSTVASLVAFGLWPKRCTPFRPFLRVTAV